MKYPENRKRNNNITVETGTRRKHRRTFILWQPVPDRSLYHVSFLPVHGNRQFHAEYAFHRSSFRNPEHRIPDDYDPMHGRTGQKPHPGQERHPVKV